MSQRNHFIGNTTFLVASFVQFRNTYVANLPQRNAPLLGGPKTLRETSDMCTYIFVVMQINSQNVNSIHISQLTLYALWNLLELRN